MNRSDRIGVIIVSFVIASGILVAALSINSPQGRSGQSNYYFETTCIQQTSDGGYVILGNRGMILYNAELSSTNHEDRIGWVGGGGSIMLVKTDVYGNVQWRRTCGGTSGHGAQSVQQTDDGGYIMLASMTVEHLENAPPGFYEDDIWLVKMDSIGNILWNRTYGGEEWEWPYSALPLPDGGYIIAATTHSYGAGSNDFWLVKTTSNGNVEWNKTYGGTGGDSISSFQSTSDGGYLIAGTTYPDALIVRDRAFYLVKTDSNGVMQWNATYPLSDPERLEFVLESSTGEYTMGGSVGTSTLNGTSTPVSWDFWLMKCDAKRNILVNKTYDLGQEEFLYSLEMTAGGGYLLAGNTWSYRNENSNIWIIKTDQNGDVEWSKIYGETGPTRFSSISKTFNSGFIIAGVDSKVGEGVWLVKIDSDGLIEWTKAAKYTS